MALVQCGSGYVYFLVVLLGIEPNTIKYQTASCVTTFILKPAGHELMVIPCVG